MAGTVRVDYDSIAPLYDSQPYREKEVDTQLQTFLQENLSRPHSAVAILDIGCGTGNQLVANLPYLREGLLVGLDLSQGMLQQAQAKTRGIGWVQADCSRPPFTDRSFDFITHQFAFHHVQDKARMIHAVYRLLKPSGRFVMTNIYPQEMSDWIYYRYFPRPFREGGQNFLAKEALVELMHQAGFDKISADIESITYNQDLGEFLETVRRRDTCAHLMMISDEDYHTGVRKLERELTALGSRGRSESVTMSLLILSGNKS